MTQKIYDMVTERIIKALEGGVIPWRQPWKQVGYPVNFITKKNYRGVNVWVLAIQRRSTPYWLTFNQCKKLGGAVKKGEKATPVIFWSFIERTDKETDEKERIPLLRYYNVFNLDQTEGLKLPEEKKLDFVPLEKAEGVVAGYKNAPKMVSEEQRAFYRPSTDTLNMPKKETFDSVEDYYSTLFHEMTHSAGHESRLNREGVAELDMFGSDKYSKEELIAEMGSAFLSGYTGVVGKSVQDNEVAYIQNWLKALQNDKRLVITASGKAQKAVDHILGVEHKDEEDK